MWPCIVTNFLLIKPTDALISQIYFYQETLHVSGSSSTHHQEFSTVSSALVYVMQVLMKAFKHDQDGTEVPLPIIRSFLQYIRHWYVSCRFLTAFKHDQDGTAIPSWSCLKAVVKTCMTYTNAGCTVENSWWWVEKLSETCSVSWQK